jgi:predicted NBD/HSP70 family sugar kinase
VKKISTVAKSGKEPKLTIGLDLGDRTSHYCIFDEAGNVILEHSLATTPKELARGRTCLPARRQGRHPILRAVSSPGRSLQFSR